MKKYIAVILTVLLLCLALSACEGNRDKKAEQSTVGTSERDDDAPLQTDDNNSSDEGDWIPKFY